MKYTDLVTLLSEARMSKYNRVTHGDKMKTIQLYHHNLKLSQRLFGVIGMFEVALRNAIHNHYRNSFDADHQLSTAYACRQYALIRTYLEYMGHDADKVLKIVEKPDSVLREIDRLAEEMKFTAISNK